VGQSNVFFDPDTASVRAPMNHYISHTPHLMLSDVTIGVKIELTGNPTHQAVLPVLRFMYEF